MLYLFLVFVLEHAPLFNSIFSEHMLASDKALIQARLTMTLKPEF